MVVFGSIVGAYSGRNASGEAEGSSTYDRDIHFGLLGGFTTMATDGEHCTAGSNLVECIEWNINIIMGEATVS